MRLAISCQPPPFMRRLFIQAGVIFPPPSTPDCSSPKTPLLHLCYPPPDIVSQYQFIFKYIILILWFYLAQINRLIRLIRPPSTKYSMALPSHTPSLSAWTFRYMGLAGCWFLGFISFIL